MHESRITARALAKDFIARGDALGWFEALYVAAAGEMPKIPWADAQPNPNLIEWLAREMPQGAGKKALVVGCGLGDDAEALSGRGFSVTAFDIAPTAIQWCRRRFPESKVRYEVEDVLAPPQKWERAFAFVLESYTLQVLQGELRARAIANIASLLCPGGMVLVICRGREPGDPPGE